MHSRNFENSEFEQLLRNLLDGRLTADDRKRLDGLLAGNASLRSRYVAHCQLHALLKDPAPSIGGTGALALTDDAIEASRIAFSETQPASRSVRRVPRVAWAGVAAAVIAMVAIFTKWRDSAQTEYTVESQAARVVSFPIGGDVVARLSQVAGARFAPGIVQDETPPAGAELRAGLYHLESGLVRIEYDSGAQVLVQAPARFKLIDRKSVELFDGRVSAFVTAAAAGFTVNTPSAAIVDFGTAFGVDVLSGKTSEVHVFEGEVEVKPRAVSNAPVDPLRLVGGQASRVDFATGVPSGIDLADQRFLRTLSTTSSAYSQRVLELQPAVYYRMEPAEDGLTIVDSSENAAHGRVEPGHNLDEIWARGKVGTALRLGGPALQRYGVVPDYKKSESDCISVVAWVWAASRPRFASIAKNWAIEDHGQFHFGLHYDVGTLEVHIDDESGASILVTDQAPLPLNEWNHVAFVADGDHLRLYRNGVEVGAAACNGLNLNPLVKTLGIGVKLNVSANTPAARGDECIWDGRLDELAVFNHALAPEQIRQLFDLGRE